MALALKKGTLYCIPQRAIIIMYDVMSEYGLVSVHQRIKIYFDYANVYLQRERRSMTHICCSCWG